MIKIFVLFGIKDIVALSLFAIAIVLIIYAILDMLYKKVRNKKQKA